MIEHKNRVPGSGKANRKLITPEGGGAAYYATVEYADDPVDAGTPINKTVLDEMLAASGMTAGTPPAFTLAQAGFSLFDGAIVRAKLHSTPSGAATLNVNGTGAKAVLTPKGKPMPAYPAGTWVTVIYNATTQNFILQGDGGSVPGQCGNGINQVSSFMWVACGWGKNYTIKPIKLP
ncbi:hypothetical protein AAFA46_08055 [Oscillospiraceae bacterium WX1]